LLILPSALASLALEKEENLLIKRLEKGDDSEMKEDDDEKEEDGEGMNLDSTYSGNWTNLEDHS
jgi:hypothetical protein